MAEILTESFCERCGTRYTFEATAARRRGLGRIRTLSRGVKNFVANDDASFADAMAAAREEDSRRASLQQLEAFHRTFNFCMSCRQYTCRNCWNTGVGECLSCAPDLSLEVLPAAFPDLALVGSETDTSTLPGAASPDRAASAWPSADRRAAGGPDADAGVPGAEPIEATSVELTPTELAAIQGALTRHVDRYEVGATLVPVAGDEPADVGEEPGRVEAAEVPPATVEAAPSVATPAGPSEPVSSARAETRRLLQRFRPRPDRATRAAASTIPSEPSTDSAGVEPALPAIAAEPALPAEPAIAVEPTAGVEPAIAAEPPGGEQAPALDEAGPAELEPAAAAVASAAPEPVADETPAEIPIAVPASPPTDVAVQPTWRMVAPDSAAAEEPEPASPSWPTPASSPRRAADATPSSAWAARVATARPLESPVWAASSRDILAAPAPGAAGPVGIHSCVSCGLSLSANARFCRRCGSRQG